MSWTGIIDYLQNFRTDQLVQQLQDRGIDNLTTNPWFLGGILALILITYFMGWRAIAGFISGIGGFILVVSLAISKGTGMAGLSGGGLWILVGGGVVVIFLFIYILFIKTE
ncbi:MAG: hypothetical protein DRH06_03765 [Deltaproteobacteria bacterium]|nr:MAG: hypothetical protein DRH07_04600 [Deltaproteobacteria bacterium]RLB77461.1 MAG: hypothetical protein DRH06_03765 [Deltaproteobacteria bacterium]